MTRQSTKAHILKNCLVTTEVLYYLPDFPSIIRPFVWQTEDIVPEIPRTKRFLNFWKQNIDGKIHTVIIGYRPLVGAGNIRAGQLITLQ